MCWSQKHESNHFTKKFQQSDSFYVIVIETVTLSKIAPPSHTKGAFDAVTAASNTQDTLKNEAQAYTYRILIRSI